MTPLSLFQLYELFGSKIDVLCILFLRFTELIYQ
nr:MAG TPA: hypothetical protein [Caudoviricetes sp.]